jgi:hypothetical protein
MATEQQLNVMQPAERSQLVRCMQTPLRAFAAAFAALLYSACYTQRVLYSACYTQRVLYPSVLYSACCTHPQLSHQVGNFIYPHVVGIIGESLAPKVTGMCLELPVAELALIMQGVEHLKSAVEQAMAVLPPDMKSQRSPAPKTSPTSVVEGASSDRWADADAMDEDGELPPVCELFASADASRERKSNAAAETEAEDEGAWQAEWDAEFWRAQPDAKVVTFISERLQEPQLRIVRAVIELLGVATALELLARTEQTQAEGGMLVAESGKPRTSGGIYLKLLKDATNLPSEEQDAALLRIKVEGKKIKPSQKGRVGGGGAGPVSPSARTPTGPPPASLGEFLVPDRRVRGGR